MSRFCAGCGMRLYRDSPMGESSIFSPHREYLLCEPCFDVEDALVENEGTNVLPDVLNFYKMMLVKCHTSERKALYG